MVDGKKLAEAGFAYLGRSYEEMDCQKFVEKCLSDCGDHTDLGGSNSWYREVRKNGWVGTPEECVKKYGSVPKGAFLFILEDVSASTPAKFRDDGIGDATHIGLVTGRGKGAIHSSHSRGGVCESKFVGKTIKNGGWNRVGLWDKVDYGIGTQTSHIDADIPSEPELVEEEIPKFVYAENGSPVNLRVKPSLKAKLVDEVPVGESVTWLKEDGSGWAYIQWGRKKGWMLECYLVDELPERPMNENASEESEIEDEVPPETTVTVWSENGLPVKLRRKPSTGCDQWIRIPVGSELTLVKANAVVDKNGESWSQVSTGWRTGWYMMTKFLTFG